MPTYDYECLKCGYVFELFQRMTEKPINKCPKCNKKSVKRLIGPGFGIIFKGSGFYETDYKRKNERQKTDFPLSKENKLETKTEASYEKKPPADKSEPKGKKGQSTDKNSETKK